MWIAMMLGWLIFAWLLYELGWRIGLGSSLENSRNQSQVLVLTWRTML